MGTNNEDVLKIHSIKVSNIKRIEAVNLKIGKKDDVIEIRGGNGAGKSSLLDSIFIALSPINKQTKICKRIGADEGKIELDLGDVIVTRYFTDTKSTLEVQSKDGLIKSAQSWLNARVGKNNFDPTKFINMSNDDRFKLLSKTLNIEDEFSELSNKSKLLNEKRLDISREIKKLDSDIIDVPKEDLDLGLEKISVEENVNMLYNIRTEKNILTNIDNDIKDAKKDIKEIEQRLKDLYKEYEQKNKKVGKNTKKLCKSLDVDTFKECEKKIHKLGYINDKIGINIVQSNAINSKDKREKALVTVKTKIESINEDIVDLIESSKVKGLEKLQLTSDKKVLWDGVDIDNICTSEKILIGVTIAINECSKIRAITISDGSLLGKDVLKKIRKLSIKFNTHIFIEFMDESGKGDLVMSDGKLLDNR